MQKGGRSSGHHGADQRPRVQTLIADLRKAVQGGDFVVGDKLPSEAALTAKYGVSRTVVREAIAGLRSEGLVESRQGAGVFLIERKPASPPSFAAVDGEKLSSLVEMMEFRIAVEAEAAGLAAVRRSPAQDAQIHEALDALRQAAAGGEPTARLDFELHIAIARAANNPRFEQFLRVLGDKAIPRTQVKRIGGADVSEQYQAQLDAEHAEIASAISAQDETRARQAMRCHLEGGLRRYRELRLSGSPLVK